MANPTYRTPTTYSNSSTSSIDLTKPTGTVDGDACIIFICYRKTMTISSSPSGFAQTYVDTGFSTRTFEVYTKIASSEPGTWSFSLSGGPNGARGVAISIDGTTMNSSTWLNAYHGETDTTSNTTLTNSGVTAPVADCLLLAGYGTNAACSFTQGSMSELYDSGAAAPGGISLYYQNLTSSGSTGSRNATLNTASEGASFVIAISPKPLGRSWCPGFIG